MSKPLNHPENHPEINLKCPGFVQRLDIVPRSPPRAPAMKKNLIKALARANVKHAHSVSTFLLNQLAYADKRYGDEKGFWLTSKSLPYKDANYPVSYLAMMLVEGGFASRKGESGTERYYLYPTTKLLKYFHGHLGDITAQLKTQEQEIARLKAKDEETQSQLSQHARRLEYIEQAIEEIHTYSPPVTPDKIAAHLRLAK